MHRPIPESAMNQPMDQYTRWWTAVATPIVTVFAVAAALWQPATAGVLFVGTVAASALVLAITPSPPRRLQRGSIAVIVVLAAVGAAVTLGGWMVPLGCLLGATSPPVLRTMARSLRGGDRVRTVRVPALPGEDAPGSVGAMSTAELCAAWSVSCVALERADTPAARARIALVRERYLDEFERRDTQGFRAWLTHGAAAAANPGSFIRVDE